MRKINEKRVEDQKGITLLALVLTIIILIILSTITIGAITGENGIIQNARIAKNNTEIANEREVVEEATLQSIRNNKRGNIVRDELQNELDKITGKETTSVTTDTEGTGYFVNFILSKRIYKVGLDGEVEYLGKEDELITQAEIIANPESNTTAKLVHEVELTVKTPIEIEDAEYQLVYAWNQDSEKAPDDSKFIEANLIGEGRIRTTSVYSSDTVGGNYYLWVRIVVGEIEKEECFGQYLIKDHTTLIAVDWNSGLAGGGFLGNSDVQRGKIQNISIINSLYGHSVNDENTWDISQSRNGMYLAWYEVNENGYYDVTIAGEGGIVANSNTNYLFKNIGYGVENQEVKITGLQYLDTGLVTNMNSMFENCKAKEIDVGKFNTENVKTMSLMFSACSNIEKLDLTNFDTSKVTNMHSMFGNCSSLTQLDLTNFDTSKVTNMHSMFGNCSSLTQLDLTNFDTSKVTDMHSMFGNCSSLTQLDLTNFDTSKVTNMQGMFGNCSVENLNLSSFDTSNVTTMWGMFENCKAIGINLSSFDTSQVTNMRQMFLGCEATKLDLSKFNTSNVTNMYRMFGWCRAIEIDVSNFNTSNVTQVEGMFMECSKLIKLNASSFTMPNCTNVYFMFGHCTQIQEINLSKFEIKEGASINKMFYMCPNLEKLDIRKLDITWTEENITFWISSAPKTCSIIVKDSMKQWFTDNFPSYTNVVVGN